LNLRGGAFHAAASLAGGVVVGVEIVVILLKKTFARRIRTPDLAGERMAMLYWLRTLYLAGAADFVSALGLVLFILSGSWGSLVFLCGLSYLFYAQAYPRARFLAE
ncbi:hypothetical protein HQ520_15300, partial [bacterium]|nr:hypothetical protein [bacterium]